MAVASTARSFLVFSILVAFGSWTFLRMYLYPYTMDQTITRKVQVIQWNPRDEITNMALQQPVPVILRNSFVQKWDALKKWPQPGYLANHESLRMVRNVEQRVGETFQHADARTPMAKANISGVPTASNYALFNISGVELFDLLHHSNSNGTRYYWYGEVIGSLAKDVSPSDFLWHTEYDKDQYGLYMWLSSAGVRSGLHYDSDHNFFVHINGSKRFILYSPTDRAHLYAYPRIHPFWHKSQIDYGNVDLSRFASATNAIGYVADLLPGDVLYVPPLWWHQVISKSPSISLASWSQFKSKYREMSMMYPRKLTWETMSLEPEEKLEAAKRFVDRLLHAFPYGQQLLDEIRHTRWKYIPQREPPEIWCNATEPLRLAKAVDDSIANDVNVAIECFTHLVPDQSEWYTNAVVQAEMADYMEIVVEQVVGPNSVGYFFMQCVG